MNDVKQSTVDTWTKSIVASKGSSAEKARQIANKIAEKVNARRRDRK